MFITLVIGLYTSRVVLNTLGVEDFGIYGVVGGIVAMMGFLNASMSGATSRFLTFELGRGDQERLAKTFSSAMIVHIGIAIVVFILAETVGLWFLCNKLVIPPDRMSAAHWVYQCSIISAMLGITQVPYNSTIIAHEKMDIYAYVEILHSVSNLLIVFLLRIGGFDKLIFYSLLMLFVSIIIVLTYRIYCIIYFRETKARIDYNKEILKPMLLFSGWDLYGNASVSIRYQGVNFIINIFFGVVYNAASSIATSVNGLLSSITGSVIQAFRPAIIKQYANDDIKGMQQLMSSATQFSILAFGCAFVPIVIFMPYLLKIWLMNVPPKCVAFCRILTIVNLLGIINSIFCIGIHATGKIKMLSFGSGTLYLLNLPVIYFMLKNGYDSEWAYYQVGLFNFFILILDLVILKLQINNFSVKSILFSVCLGCFIIIVSFIPSYIVYCNFGQTFTSLIIVIIVNLITIFSLTYYMVLSHSQKQKINNSIRFIFFSKRHN